jgi:Tol biopolymer transport system component
VTRFLRGVLALWILWVGAVSFASFVGTLEPIDVLAFDSNRNGDYDVYILDLSTGVQINMTRNTTRDRNPAWSADGRYLAFESVQPGAGNGIFILDLQNLGLGARRITPEFIRAVQPDWSPRGNYIAFSGSLSGMFNNEIFLVNRYDGQVIRVTNSPNEFDYNPRWSPDGQQLVYGVYDATVVAPSSVYVVRFQEMALQLAQERPQFRPVKVSDQESAADPGWTPDGDVYFRYELNQFTLYRTEPVADAPDEPIYRERVVMEKPDLSPDGEWIAFGYAPQERDLWRELVVARLDGTVMYPVTFGAQAGNYWDSAPAWKPR